MHEKLILRQIGSLSKYPNLLARWQYVWTHLRAVMSHPMHPTWMFVYRAITLRLYSALDVDLQLCEDRTVHRPLL